MCERRIERSLLRRMKHEKREESFFCISRYGFSILFLLFVPLQSQSAAHTSILLLRWFSDFPIYLMAHRDRNSVETGSKKRENVFLFAFFYVCCALKCLTSSLNSQYGISGAGAERERGAKEMWNVFVFICTSHSSCYVRELLWVCACVVCNSFVTCVWLRWSLVRTSTLISHSIVRIMHIRRSVGCGMSDVWSRSPRKSFPAPEMRSINDSPAQQNHMVL